MCVLVPLVRLFVMVVPSLSPGRRKADRDTLRSYHAREAGLLRLHSLRPLGMHVCVLNACLCACLCRSCACLIVIIVPSLNPGRLKADRDTLRLNHACEAELPQLHYLRPLGMRSCVELACVRARAARALVCYGRALP